MDREERLHRRRESYRLTYKSRRNTMAKRSRRRKESKWGVKFICTEGSNTKIQDSNTALAVCDKCNAKMKLAKCANQYVAIVTLKDKWYLHNTP